MKPLMCNVGSTDRAIRITLGLVIVITFFAMKSWFWLLGLILVVSGILELCPLYLLFGINTCKVPKKWWH